jgi:hypothetical protein
MIKTTTVVWEVERLISTLTVGMALDGRLRSISKSFVKVLTITKDGPTLSRILTVDVICLQPVFGGSTGALVKVGVRYVGADAGVVLVEGWMGFSAMGGS